MCKLCDGGERWFYLIAPRFALSCFGRLVILDVMAPRSEIENAEYENDDESDEDIFNMDLTSEIKNCKLRTLLSVFLIISTFNWNWSIDTLLDRDDEMRNEKAETLDICMDKLFAYIETEYNKKKGNEALYNMLMRHFENVILPTHKSHHVQFVIFYFCSFRVS